MTEVILAPNRGKKIAEREKNLVERELLFNSKPSSASNCPGSANAI